MALTAQQRIDAGRDLMEAGWIPPGVLKSEVLNTINAIDDLFESSQAAWNLALPQPYRGAADLDMKSVLFALIALRRASILIRVPRRP